MTLKDLVEKLLFDMELGIPVFIWGPPGGGKSQMIRDIAERRGVELKDLRLLHYSPIDLKGLPYLKDMGDGRKESCWARPAILPEAGEGILFLDELNLAPREVQQAAYQLLTERRVGDHRLGDGWKLIAAGNRPEDGAGVAPIPSPLVTRFLHLGKGGDIPRFTNLPDKGVFNMDDLEEVSMQERSYMHPEVIAFLRFKPELIYKEMATPRSWTYLSRVIRDISLDDAEALAVSSGLVGVGAATEFLAFRAVAADLPDLDAVLDGQEYKPTQADISWAFVTGILSRAHARIEADKKATKSLLKRLLEISLDLEYEFGAYLFQLGFRQGIFSEAALAKIDVWKDVIRRYQELSAYIDMSATD